MGSEYTHTAKEEGKNDDWRKDILTTGMYDGGINNGTRQPDDGKLNVTITLTIAPGKTMEQYDLDAKISYVSEKVSEKITAKVTENQGDLPLGGDARTK